MNVIVAKLGDSGGLVAATDGENIWTWNQSEKWGDKPLTIR